MIFDVDDSDSDLSSLDGSELSDWEGSDSGSEYDGSDLGLDSDDEDDVITRDDDIRWNIGQVITVKFLGGTPAIHRQVEKYAKVWMEYANIKFKFVPRRDPANVRISFFKNQGCHSKIGTNALKVPPDKPTMNLGFTKDTSPERIRRTVLHEFGHVLGCSHEHSSPNANIAWDRKAVYKHFSYWDKEKTDRNVLTVKRENAVASEFDRKSIMIYEIPSKITKNGFSAPWNTCLSEIDKRVIAEQYPKPTRCHRCRDKIHVSYDIHGYCAKHVNYLCEGCYDSSSTRSQVRRGSCRYTIYNDRQNEFEECNRCHIGLRRSRDETFYCRNHDNYLCGGCYNTSSTRNQVKRGSCSYYQDEDSESESDSDDEDDDDYASSDSD